VKRWLWVIALALVAAAGIFLGFREQPVPVETVAVKTAPLRVTVEEEGKTRLRTRYVIYAPVAGYMRRLKWRVGDEVRAGETITVLEPPRPAVLDARTLDQNKARVAAAEAALVAAEMRVRTLEEQVNAAIADRDYWHAQRERERALSKSGDIPAARLDRTLADVKRADAAVSAAQRSVATARADVKTAQAEVAAAQTALRQTAAPSTGELIPVRAPTGGRVIQLMRESEGMVAPADPLMEIGNARAIEVVVEVLSPDAVKIAPGTRVVLERWGGPRPLEARVRLIEPGGFTKISALGVEEQRVRVVADITSSIDDWQRLGDGYRVEASFILWEGERVLQVPANALFRVNGSWSAFAVENGFARRRQVEIGHRSGIAVEVTSGLREGEIVIAHPDETVSDGKPVKSK